MADKSQLDTNGTLAISRMLPEPRFTILRLLGSVALVAVGCWIASLVANPGERFVIVIASVGSAIGLISGGPRGTILGAAVAWLLMGATLVITTIAAVVYLFLFDK